MRSRNFFIVLAIVALIATFAYITFSKQPPVTTKQSFVATKLQTCARYGTSGASLVSCSKEVIRNLLTQHSTEEIMASIATGTVPAMFGSCHQVGHIVGEETFKKAGDVEKALSQCTNDCGNSCIHGVIGAAVVKELGQQYSEEDIAHASIFEIEQVGAKYCSRARLCHAVGHLLFIATNNFEQALNSCDRISSGVSSEVCYEGVFMQGIGGIPLSLVTNGGPPPVATVPAGDYQYPCDKVSTTYHHACYLYLARYQDLLFKEKGTVDQQTKLAVSQSTCSALTGRSRADCFEGIGRNGFNIADSSQEVHAFCNKLNSGVDRNSCVLGRAMIVAQFGKYSDAVNFCSIVDSSSQKLCFNALFQSFSLAGTGSDASTVCSSASDENLCGNSLQEYERTKDTLPDYHFGIFGEPEK